MKFKVGDIVKRTAWQYKGMVPGDEDVVKEIRYHDNGLVMDVVLKKFGWGHAVDSLELIKPVELNTSSKWF